MSDVTAYQSPSGPSQTTPPLKFQPKLDRAQGAVWSVGDKHPRRWHHTRL